MQWLAYAMQDVVGDVDDVVDWALANCIQLVFQPLWAFLDFDAADCDACVARACCGVVDLYIGCAVLAVGGESFYRRALKRGRCCMACKPGGEVARHAVV